MFILGLTGSIAMGKTTTARLFAEEGVPVHDADAAVHRLYEGEAAAAIEAAFPGTTKDGKVDRAALSQHIVGDPEKLRFLESVVHPLVAKVRDRFLAEEVWETLGLPVEECVRYVDSSAELRKFRSALFTRIVPTIKDIGLWGPKIRRAYANMGILGFADVDTEALSRDDERVAMEFDKRRQ